MFFGWALVPSNKPNFWPKDLSAISLEDGWWFRPSVREGRKITGQSLGQTWHRNYGVLYRILEETNSP